MGYHPNADEPHSHKCNECGTVWFHDPDALKERLYTEAHRCPNCGREQFFTCNSDNWPAFFYDGAVTLRFSDVYPEFPKMLYDAFNSKRRKR